MDTLLTKKLEFTRRKGSKQGKIFRSVIEKDARYGGEPYWYMPLQGYTTQTKKLIQGLVDLGLVKQPMYIRGRFVIKPTEAGKAVYNLGQYEGIVYKNT